MIYVRIELWRRGNRNDSKVLSEATISNIGGDTKTGHYLAVLSKFGGFQARQSSPIEDSETARICHPVSSSIWKKGKVGPFDRQRRGSWDLLFRALKDVVGYRNR